jgi:hypothetical protein
MAQVHSIPGHEFAQVAAVDDRERVEPEDAGQNALGLDVGQAAGRNGKFLVAIFVGDARLELSTSRMVRPSFSRNVRRLFPAGNMVAPPTKVLESYQREGAKCGRDV